jgi:hypothetical protein
VIETISDLFGCLSISCIPGSRFSFSAAILNCSHATDNAVCVFSIKHISSAVLYLLSALLKFGDDLKFRKKRRR